MSLVKVAGNASGTGTLTIQAPNTNSNYTLTLPAETGTITTGASTPTFTGAVTAPGFIPNGSTVVTDGMFLPAASTVALSTGSTEHVRITSGGYFKASYNGTYDSSTGAYHEFIGNGSVTSTLTVYNRNASFTNYVTELFADRNTTNATYYFLRCRIASVADKLYIADSGNVTNTNGSYGTLSDAKLKQDITDATPQWDDIKNLRFRKYRLKSEVELNSDAKPLLGLVAQEVELVSPGLIEEHQDIEDIEVPAEDENGNPVFDEEGNQKTERKSQLTGTTTKAIKTSILYMKAIKALQEAMTRIEALEAEVAALKAKA